MCWHGDDNVLPLTIGFLIYHIEWIHQFWEYSDWKLFFVRSLWLCNYHRLCVRVCVCVDFGAAYGNIAVVII